MSTSLIDHPNGDGLLPALVDPQVPGGSDDPSQGESPLSAQALLGAMRRWWPVALPLGIVFALATAAAIYLTSEPVYRASAWLKIRAESPYVVFKNDRIDDDAERFIETQVELIRSPMVVAPLLSDPEIAGLGVIREEDDPVAWLASEIGVLQRGDSELFRVSLESTDALAAQKIVNALTESYLEFRKKQEVETKRRVFALLQKEKEQYYDEIKRVRGNLQTLIDQSLKDEAADALSPDGGRAALISDTMQHLIAIDLQRFSLRAEKEMPVEPEFDREAIEDKIRERLGGDVELAQYRADLGGVTKAIDELDTLLRRPERAPQYQELIDRAVALERAITQRASAIETTLRSAAVRDQAKSDRLRKAEYDSRMAELDMQQEHLKALLDEQIEQHQQQQNTSGDSIEIEFLRDELTLAESMQNEISHRITQLRVESQAIDRVERLLEAEIEGTPVVDTPWKKLLAAAFGAWLFPFVVALVAERAMRRVCDTRSLEAHSKAPVLCEISRLPAISEAKTDRAQAQLDEALRVFEESTNVLATTVRWAKGFKGVRVLAVTSATQDEGKTTLSAQLSICLAEAGAKTLLIDCDVRSPDAHNVFGVEPQPGLAEVLAGTVSVEEAIKPTAHAGLWILPAGIRGEGNALRLFGELPRRVLAAISEDFEHVVLDTPPVLHASESILAARSADATILCAMRDKSRGEQVREAGRRLESAGGRLAGVVLNGVSTNRYSAAYGRYGELDTESATVDDPVGATPS